MSSSSNPAVPFPRFLTFFMIVGVFGALFMVSLPVLIASAFKTEAERYELCQNHLRYDCEPSVMWALRGWGEEQASTSTVSGTDAASSTAMISDVSPTSTIEGTSAFQLFASSSTASSTPLLLKLQSDQLTRNGDVYRAQVLANVTLTVEAQETKTVTVQVGTSTSSLVTLKSTTPGIFKGTVKLPRILPTTLELILKNGDDIWTGYRLSVASNQ